VTGVGGETIRGLLELTVAYGTDGSVFFARRAVALSPSCPAEPRVGSIDLVAGGTGDFGGSTLKIGTVADLAFLETAGAGIFLCPVAVLVRRRPARRV
jgi:hypothetical protein